MSRVLPDRVRNAVPGLWGPARFAQMAGSSIAGPSAAGWVTDFLNAAYFARPVDERTVADLRLAAGIVTTHWAGLGGRRLRGSDVLAYHGAYGGLRMRGRGRLDRERLHAGARVLIGDWFTEAWADPRRRAHGIAFTTEVARAAFTPERRLHSAALGVLTPPRSSPERQHWATYEPVGLADPEATLRWLEEPARWPDFASDAGRFTALRSGGLLNQTFEIEVVAHPTPRSPIYTRGYVTCTAVVKPGDGELTRALGELSERVSAGAGGERTVLPPGAQPLALIVLTTHEGHFLGRARSHLLVWREDRGAWICDVGAWDPLPPHLNAAYTLAGRSAQRDFWGPHAPAHSMLAQLAAVSSGGAGDLEPNRGA